MRNFTSGALAIAVATAFSTAALLNVGAGTAQAVAASPATAGSPLASQTSNVQGVTIKVTPKNLATDAKTWDFEVVFDSHTQDLTDDVVKSSLLLDGAGGQYRPLAWDGNPPGGHHREGVLRFKPLAAQPQAMELQITRPGESAPRSFRWQLK